MKVNENEKQDKYGIYPCCWISGGDATPQELHQWLFNHYQGYKFVIMFDCTKDEFEKQDKETPVYFLDTVFDEFLDYVGIDMIKDWLKRKELAG